MGNSASAKGKLIFRDGSVREFGADVALTAAELMMEHPQQAVVELHVVGPPAPLPADARLEARKVYAMVPLRRGKPRCAQLAEELQSVGLHARASATGLVPLLVRMCRPSAAAPMVTRRREKRGRATSDCGEEEKKCVSLEGYFGESEYLSRQSSGKRGVWKPSLDTIEEKIKADQKKVPHWLF